MIALESHPLRLSIHRSFLVVESADSAVYAWLNGTLVGYSQDSRLPAEFEVTGLLRSGSQSNVLVLQVVVLLMGSRRLAITESCLVPSSSLISIVDEHIPTGAQVV